MRKATQKFKNVVYQWIYDVDFMDLWKYVSDICDKSLIEIDNMPENMHTDRWNLFCHSI